MSDNNKDILASQDEYRYGFHDDIQAVLDTGKGLSEQVVRQISDEVTEEYEDLCKDEGLDPERNESALAFLDFKEDLFEESISN